jgi:hypothetical protein
MSLNGSENNCMSVDKQQENNKKIVGKPFVKAVERTADVTDKWHDIVASAYSETE